MADRVDYHTADRMLTQCDDFSVELFRKICKAVHQEGRNSTLYSTVYDLKRKVIHLYHFHDFDNVVVLDLEEELAKGEHVVEMPSFFPTKAAYERFRKSSTTDRAPRAASDRAVRD